jgi:hypothetical protein
MPDVNRGGRSDDGHGLDWKDYVAIFIALLQTVALPILLLIVAIVVALLALRLLH